MYVSIRQVKTLTQSKIKKINTCILFKQETIKIFMFETPSADEFSKNLSKGLNNQKA